MRRRAFIAGLAGAAAWPLAARAQSGARLYRIGVLDTSAPQLNGNFKVLREALLALGYVEGQNLRFEYRSADGRNEAFPALAGELARLEVDLIVTRGTPAALAAKAATATIPVVMATVGEPAAIVRGTSNLTGFGAILEGAERRRLEALRDLLPKLARFAALMNLSNPSRASEWAAIEAGAHALGIEARSSTPGRSPTSKARSMPRSASISMRSWSAAIPSCRPTRSASSRSRPRTGCRRSTRSATMWTQAGSSPTG